MATITATVGSTTANSYLTVAEANTYFETRLHSDDWDDATDANKTAALINATRLLDREADWTEGAVVSTSQALMWPRSGCVDSKGVAILTTAIPNEVKYATAEVALALLGEDLETSTDAGGVDSVGFGPISASFAGTGSGKALPNSAIAFIRIWGRLKKSANVKLERK